LNSACNSLTRKEEKNTETIEINTANVKLHVIFHHAAIPVTTEIQNL